MGREGGQSALNRQTIGERCAGSKGSQVIPHPHSPRLGADKLPMQLGINATLPQQTFKGAALDNSALLQHQNQIRPAPGLMPAQTRAKGQALTDSNSARAGAASGGPHVA